MKEILLNMNEKQLELLGMYLPGVSSIIYIFIFLIIPKKLRSKICEKADKKEGLLSSLCNLLVRTFSFSFLVLIVSCFAVWLAVGYLLYK